MKKQNLAYFKYYRNIAFLLLIFFFHNCQNYYSPKSFSKNEDSIVNQHLDTIEFNLLLKDYFKIDITNYSYVLYFVEKGCVGCNDRFFRILNKNKFKNNVLIIFSGNESNFNFEQIDTLKGNQILDKNQIFQQLSYLQLPSMIKITSGEIDTIYKVDANFKQFDSIIHTILLNESILYE